MFWTGHAEISWEQNAVHISSFGVEEDEWRISEVWPMRAAADVACLRWTVSLHERNTGSINLDQVKGTRSEWH
jgi:hypothetical protein